MYYILYAILYAISLLPFFILYALSDFFHFVVYRLVGYRKDVVFGNLNIAFPEKSKQEKEVIASQFYRNLIDTFIESIKLLSISDEAFSKRVTIDFHPIDELIAKGKSVQLHSGHQMNWEYAHWAVAMQVTIPWLGVYMRINNKAVDRLFYKIRNRGKTVLIAAQDFKSRAHECFNDQYTLGLAADQNPGVPGSGNWLNFFNRPAPFAKGPDTGAIKNNTAVVFVKFVKLKRGFYHFETKLVTENAATLEAGKLTLLYRDFLEETIRERPDNYLWSHRRWKWSYKAEYEKRWIDVTPPPIEP